MMNAALLSSDKLDWCTPLDFFNELDSEFHFDLDAAATPKSAKCSSYFTASDDALKQDWGGHTVFLNPPYGRTLHKWVQKAHDESQKEGTTVVVLIPARTDTAYFHDYILGKAEIRFLRGRLRFTDEDGNAKDAAPFPSLLAIFRGPGAGRDENDAIVEALDGKEMTANELTAHLQGTGVLKTADRNQVSPRLTKLRTKGRIDTVGKRVCSVTGKQAIVWTAHREAQP